MNWIHITFTHQPKDLPIDQHVGVDLEIYFTLTWGNLVKHDLELNEAIEATEQAICYGPTSGTTHSMDLVNFLFSSYLI